jgi:hypothetical protein
MTRGSDMDLGRQIAARGPCCVRPVGLGRHG